MRSAEATLGQARVRMTGELKQLNPVIGSAHVDVPAVISLIHTLAPAVAVEGDIGARAEIVADRSGQRATVVADATAVRLAGVGPFSGQIAGHVEGAVLRVDDIDLVAYGGRIRGEGVVSLDGETSELRVGARGVDLSRVLASHAPTARRVASHADADLSLRMARWDWRTVGADGTITFRRGTGPGIPLRGAARFSVDHQRVRLAADALRVHEVDLRMQGTIGFDGRLDLRYGARLADISRLPAVLAGVGVAVPRPGVPRLDMRGALSADGTVNGMPGRWVARATVAGRSLAIEHHDLDVSSELRVTPTSVRLVSLSVAGPDGAVSASGDIPTGRTDAWRIAGSFERLRLGDWLARGAWPSTPACRAASR